jgi:hypothetical protein
MTLDIQTEEFKFVHLYFEANIAFYEYVELLIITI